MEVGKYTLYVIIIILALVATAGLVLGIFAMVKHGESVKTVELEDFVETSLATVLTNVTSTVDTAIEDSALVKENSKKITATTLVDVVDDDNSSGRFMVARAHGHSASLQDRSIGGVELIVGDLVLNSLQQKIVRWNGSTFEDTDFPVPLNVPIYCKRGQYSESFVSVKTDGVLDKHGVQSTADTSTIKMDSTLEFDGTNLSIAHQGAADGDTLKFVGGNWVPQKDRVVLWSYDQGPFTLRIGDVSPSNRAVSTFSLAPATLENIQLNLTGDGTVSAVTLELVDSANETQLYNHVISTGLTAIAKSFYIPNIGLIFPDIVSVEFRLGVDTGFIEINSAIFST
jgi:hypothetical protein